MSSFDTEHSLILPSAWWGESFVTELRRISETPDRKVHFANVTVAGVEDSTKTAGEKASEESSVKDKESEPATAAQA